jgi:formate/nitrite transporter
MSEQVFTPSGLDALPPPAMARRAEEVGEAKAVLPTVTILALAVLAGAFIALGAIFATTVMSNGDTFAYGVNRLLGGLTFSLGLILVVVAGAELFTGNNLIVMAWASRRVSTGRLLGNWTLVWVGNFAGAIATAGLMYFTRQYTFGHGAVGETALTIANTKTGLGWGQAFALGIFCNALVCLAVWLCYGARTVTDRSSRSSSQSVLSSRAASSTRSRTCTSSRSACSSSMTTPGSRHSARVRRTRPTSPGPTSCGATSSP